MLYSDTDWNAADGLKTKIFTSFARGWHLTTIACKVFQQENIFSTMLSADKRKNPSEDDGGDEEIETEMYSENQDAVASSIPTTKKRKRDLAWSILKGLSGPDPYEGIVPVH